MPGSRRVQFLLLIVATALLAACAAKPPPLRLDTGDDGASRSLAVGQQVVVTLDANPTTGYQWAVDGKLPPQLEQVGEPRLTPDSKALGSGGTQVWTFAGTRKGKAALRLKYWRSFEPTVPPIATYSVGLDVR